MRLFAHNFLGPRIYATFENGIAYEYVAGKNLDYELAVDRNVYPLVATKGIILDKSLYVYIQSAVCLPTFFYILFYFYQSWNDASTNESIRWTQTTRTFFTSNI